jgi:Alkylmercury lyase
MLAFRSEEHLERWLSSGRNPSGETMSLKRQWQLAQRWFAGRHKPDWKRRDADEVEAVFGSVGLTSDFWKLS